MVRETGTILQNFSYHVASRMEYFCFLFCTDKMCPLTRKQRTRITSVLERSSDLGIVTWKDEATQSGLCIKGKLWSRYTGTWL